MKTLRFVLLLAAFGVSHPVLSEDAASGGFSCPEGDNSLACQQKKELEEMWVAMNQSSRELIDTIVTQPKKAVDMGCLDQLRQLDFNMFTVDPRSIWSTLSAQILDAITNRVCNAIEEQYNEYAAQLELDLEAPMGLGRISLQQSGYANSLEGLTDTNVRISNEEATQQVIIETFGEYPVPRNKQYTESLIQQMRVDSEGMSDRKRRSQDEEKLENMLNFNRLWSDEKESEKDDN